MIRKWIVTVAIVMVVNNVCAQHSTETNNILDYDGDGTNDLAVYNIADARWCYKNSSNGETQYVQYGISDHIPVPGDYDGDGITDIAAFYPSELIRIHMPKTNENSPQQAAGYLRDKNNVICISPARCLCNCR